MFSRTLIDRFAAFIAEDEGWRIAQHDALYDEARDLLITGSTPEAVAMAASWAFDLDAEDEAHVLRVLRGMAAELLDGADEDAPALPAELDL